MVIDGKKDTRFFCLDPEGVDQDLHNNTINLSSRDLSLPEINLLDKGLKFIPTPKKISKPEILESASDFSRKLKITNFFHNKPKNPNKKQFVDKSNWNPPETTVPPTINSSVKSIFKDLSQIPIQKEKTNITKDETEAIKTLKTDPSIIIKKADKGSSTIIMDKSDYIWEVERQLNNPKHYKPLQAPIFPVTMVALNKILHTLETDKYLSKKQLKYLSPKDDPKPRHIYILPKIHKPPDKWSKPFEIPPGRPIISDVESESYRISEYIDNFLAPLSIKHPAYLKDTYDFIEKISKLNIPPNSLLISLDVDSMYTNIDNKDGLKSVAQTFKDNPDPKRPDLEILQLLKLGLEKNDFEFNDKWYLQTSGTAMGKKFAPSYANIFMAHFEKEALAKCPHKPLVYVRFLDDIFIIWTHSREQFDDFFQTLNEHHPSIKLKATISENSIDFLDATVFKGPNFQNTGKLDIKVYFKPTDTHQLLHKKSFHPKHSFKGIIKSQIIRFFRICTQETDFNEAVQTLFKALRNRGYSYRFLRKIKGETLAEIDPQLNNFASPCQSTRCATCPFVKTTPTFTSSTTSKTHVIRQDLDCSSKNVIYLITCSICQNQYVGQTTLALRERFTNHRFDINHKKDKPVSNHFNQQNHSLKNASIIPIEQVNNINQLNDREQFWIDKLQTLTPKGINEKVISTTIFPFIITYNKTANLASRKVREHYIKLQTELPGVFKSKLVTAYRKNKNLHDLLVRSKLVANLS